MSNYQNGGKNTNGIMSALVIICIVSFILAGVTSWNGFSFIFIVSVVAMIIMAKSKSKNGKDSRGSYSSDGRYKPSSTYSTGNGGYKSGSSYLTGSGGHRSGSSYSSGNNRYGSSYKPNTYNAAANNKSTHKTYTEKYNECDLDGCNPNVCPICGKFSVDGCCNDCGYRFRH